jgi:hypothetical protein
LNYIGWRASPVGVADIGWRYWLNYIGWRDILPPSHKKRLISAGLRGIYHAFPKKVTPLVRKKMAEIPPFSIYIYKYNDLFIYISPPRFLILFREGGREIYI